MSAVNDLNITKELLPLFDYTHNSFAYEALSSLLHDQPPTISAIIERQLIIKAFVNSQIQAVSYVQTDLHETYAFLNTINNNDLFNVSVVELNARLVLSSAARQQIRSRIVQCILLFHKLHQGYFSRLSLQEFPIAFQPVINHIIHFFNHFHLDSFYPAIRNDRFSNKHIVHVVTEIKKHTNSSSIQTFWNNLFLFEAYLSVSIAHKNLRLQFPVFTDNHFSIADFYHPALKAPVRNSICPDHNVLLLTGPNMAGKSTLLKAIGICVYLGRQGFGIPASSGEMPFFDLISVNIHSKDDLKGGYSHFLSEIKAVKEVVSEASHKKCFAVFDELYKGTNIEDALDILKVTINGLPQFNNSIFIISTHLQQLKQFVDPDAISTYYIECNVTDGQPAFTYQLQKGWSDVKLGKVLFEREGLYQLLAKGSNQ